MRNRSPGWITNVIASNSLDSSGTPDRIRANKIKLDSIRFIKILILYSVWYDIV